MTQIPIRIPDPVYPKADPENPCPCTERPMELEFKTCLFFPLCQAGDTVRAGQIVAEFECEKKTGQIPAPADGRLAPWLLEEGDEFEPDAVLGFIEVP